LGFFGLFKKRSEEEEFSRAVSSRDYLTVAEIGEKLIKKYPDSVSILNSYVDALVKLGKKEKAVKALLSFAEKKIKEEYYDIAIPVLKKVLKIDPVNIQALKLLIQAYRKKELFYEAFKVLEEAYKEFKKSGGNTEVLTTLFEKFLQEQFHPLFYEKYADILMQEGKKDEAFTNYILTGNMYANIGNYKAALRAFLKAREIKQTENLDRQIVETLSYLSDSNVGTLLIKLIDEYHDNPDFLKFVVSVFKPTQRLNFLKNIAKSVTSPKAKYFLLSLINFELGEVEEGYEYLEKLKLLDSNMYKVLYTTVSSKYPDLEEMHVSFSTEELPDIDDILGALDQVIEGDFETVAHEYVKSSEEPKEESRNITTEIKMLEEDGTRYISMAEAMIGIGNFESAIENAEKAMNSDKYFFKAVQLIANAYRLQGRFRDALAFLMDHINDPRLTEEQQARLKEIVGEIYEELGEKDRALLWYKEADRVLNDPDIKEKINQLERAS
jgi:tetratricopeptide (TPR) repeat protein